MPRYSILLIAVAAWLTGLAPADAQQPTTRPCSALRQICEQAGFIPKGRHDGLGIVSDCVRPIMLGTPQRKRAAKPLPAVDPALVAACRARNPTYGQRRTQPGNEQPPAPGMAPRAPGAVPQAAPPSEDEALPQDEPPQKK